jgi:transcriptional antiterminator RfaH
MALSRFIWAGYMHWYALRSKPNKEFSLWRELSARGAECFYPHLHVRPVNPRSRKIRPYFPGYLFLQVDLKETGPSAFQWMPFSSGFVSFDGVPAAVPHNLIQAIRRHVEEINAANDRELPDLRHGEQVVIDGGLFSGYEALFDAHLPGRDRVRVLLKLLEARQVNIELPAAQIQRQKPRSTGNRK